MRRTFGLALATALALTILSVGSVAASDPEQPAPADTEQVTPRLTGLLSVGQWGTAWTPERRAKFSQWAPKGWGTQVKAKAAGDEWVHIPLILNTYLGWECPNPVQQSLSFCATSSAPARTRPIQFDVWATQIVGENPVGAPQQVFSAPIDFWDSGHYCVTFGMTAEDYEAMGFSVLLHFADAADRITLGMARVNGWC